MSTSDEQHRVVPLYAITHGRTRSASQVLPLESMVTTTPQGLAALDRLQFEQARIVRFCRRPMSVAEVAAELSVPLGVARMLVSDLNDEGMLTVHVPKVRIDGRAGVQILERLMEGLRAKD
jgi:uncharacterized protein DUF742